MDKEKKSIFKRIALYFFDTKIDARVRLYHLILFNIAFASLIAMIPTAINHSEGMWLNVLLFSMAVFAEILSRHNMLELGGLLMALVAVLFILPIMYFYQGGMVSAMPLWFVVCSLAAFLIVGDRFKYPMLILGVLVAAVCLTVEYLHPEYITPLSNDLAVYIDLLSGIIVATAVLFVIFIMHINTEKRQRLTLEAQQKELLEKQKQLEYALNNDALTKILNRYSYTQQMEELEKAELPEDLVAITADINGLKWTNDNLGHIAGDELISGAAKVMQDSFGEYGYVYRIGGDEFQAIIRTSETEETLRRIFTGHMMTWKGSMVNEIHISVGFAFQSVCHAENFMELQRVSDRKMYEDKREFYSKKENDRRN